MAGKIALEMVDIPGGDFLMGDPPERVHVEPFRICKYPVTNAQYKRFLDLLSSWQRTTISVPQNWSDGQVPPGKEEHPVTFVNWYEALYFAQWLNLRLPTETEWEKSARGGLFLDEQHNVENPIPDRRFPWGNEFDAQKCNMSESGKGGTTPVSHFQNGQSPYGVMNLCGNVWEWCSTIYETKSEDLTAYGARVLRGGAWSERQEKAPCFFRYRHNMEYQLSSVGFRCAASL